MIRILLVDDDVRAIEGIAKSVDWQALGIGKHYLAHSAQQAREILGQTDIDILLSDIEMPKGSGLELVEWVNANKEDVVCIFLTSHANFEYANKALRLGSIDYLLKPTPHAELADAVAKAVARVMQLRQRKRETRQAAYWKENHRLVAERFWFEVVCGVIPPEEESLAKRAAQKHIEYSGAALWPVLFELAPAEQDAWGPGLLETALYNIMEETLRAGGAPPILLRLEKDTYMALVNAGFGQSTLREACAETVNICGALFSRAVKCGIGRLVPPWQLYAEATALLNARFAAEGCPPGMVLLTSAGEAQTALDMGDWLGELAQGNYTEALATMKSYLATAVIGRERLVPFYQSFMWGVYPLLQQKGISAQELFAGQDAAQIAGQALHSLPGLTRWVEFIVTQLSLAESGKDDTLAWVKYYINEHLAEDLNRDAIAAAAYVSPDYLSHMFKAKTGVSLFNYIIEQRMQRAKELLAATGMPIHKVATAVGYNNIPYFSKLFKRSTGKTPVEYRRALG